MPDAFDSQHEASHLQSSIRIIAAIIRLFNDLHDHLQKANRAYDRFIGPRGDISYFSDIKDPRAQGFLRTIEKSFERLVALEENVVRMVKKIEAASHIVSYQLCTGYYDNADTQ